MTELPAHKQNIASAKHANLLRLILLGLAVHLILPQLASIEHSLQVIRTMTWWAVALAVVSQVFSYLGSGYTLQAIVSIVKQRLSIIRGVTITLAASSIGLVAGGMFGNTAATYRWLHRDRISAEGAGLAGFLPVILNNGMLILAAIFGIAYLLARHELSIFQIISFALILAVLILIICLVIWGMGRREQMKAAVLRIAARWAGMRRNDFNAASVEQIVDRFFAALDKLRGDGWRRPAQGALLNTGFDIMTLYFLFIAAGYSVGPGVLLAGYGMPLLFGKMAFLLPGGVGVVEGSMIAIYYGLGVPQPAAVVVILTYRLLSFWLPSLIGFPLAAYLQGSADNHRIDDG